MRHSPTLALAVLLAASAGAQELPEERAEAERTRAAIAQAQRAWSSIEAYGQRVTRRALDPRDLAYDRLTRPLGPEPKAEPRAPLSAREELEQLTTYRQAILARLELLDGRAREDETDAEDDEDRTLLLEIYDVQDLVHQPEDHAAPAVGLGSSVWHSTNRSSGVLSFDDPDEPLHAGVNADTLIELIEDALGEDDDDGSVEFSDGRLLVRKPARSHEKIQALLAQLRSTRGGLVDLEVRVYRMRPALYEQLRGRGGGLSEDDEALLADAVRDERAAVLATHRVVAHDGQQVALRRGGSRSYVADIEVNQTGVVPVLNPVVQVLNEGLLVQLRPLVDRRRGRVLIDVALSQSKLISPLEARLVHELELELPKLDVSRTTSTSSVPVGRGMLLGGVLNTADEASPLTSVVYVRPRLVRGR